MSIEEVSRVIRAYQERYMVLDWDPAYKLVIIFRNHGGKAGASQVHPHSQIAAASLVPLHMRYALMEAQRYYEETTFADLQPEDIEPLSQILHDVLAKFYRGMNNPDYNYCIRSAPHYSSSGPYYHWHIQIMPRLTTPAGFEIGSGISINVALPEESAKFLREIKI
jgi:UDPglucose--hexose-1-phosphate uridylyltransferase